LLNSSRCAFFAEDIDALAILVKRSVMANAIDKCASCLEPVTAGDHERRLLPPEMRECPICGSDLVRGCERVDGSRVVRCSGGHVLPASALELF
jgi:hypothetical protein